MLNIVFENNTTFTIDLLFLDTIAKSVSDQEIEFILTHNDEIQEINLTTRGINKPTDVLSFPYENMPHTPLGSIVISADFVKEKSEFYGHKFEEELALLFIHGLLHLLGFDHEVDNGEHRKKEEEMIQLFNLPKSLIVRVSDTIKD